MSTLKHLSFLFVLIILQTNYAEISRQEKHLNIIFKQVSSLFQLNVTVIPEDISFYYYNQNIQDGVELNLAKFNGTVPNYNEKLLNYFISHGSGNSYSSMKSTKDLILAKEDSNIFLIDWSKHAAMFYTVIVPCVPKLSEIMAKAVDKLRKTYDIPFENINLIGHSLGAHVVGGIGAFFEGKVNYIIGLDPAAPLFQNEKPMRRLDSSDAQFVQVLHTNGGFQGMMRNVGHADFYPNGGGMNQPGCGSDLFGACAHARAMTIYRESLKTGGLCARLCSSYQSFKSGVCDNGNTSYFGEINVDKSANGKFYFDTNSESPFATGRC